MPYIYCIYIDVMPSNNIMSALSANNAKINIFYICVATGRRCIKWSTCAVCLSVHDWPVQQMHKLSSSSVPCWNEIELWSALNRHWKMMTVKQTHAELPVPSSPEQIMWQLYRPNVAKCFKHAKRTNTSIQNTNTHTARTICNHSAHCDTARKMW